MTAAPDMLNILPSPRELLAGAGYPTPELVWRDFLTTVVGPCNGIVDLRFIREETVRRIEAHSTDEAVEIIGSQLDWNVYFGVATRRLPKSEFDRLEAQREPNPKRRRKAGGKFSATRLCWSIGIGGIAMTP